MLASCAPACSYSPKPEVLLSVRGGVPEMMHSDPFTSVRALLLAYLVCEYISGSRAFAVGCSLPVG